jgi:hypothetical protein
MPNWNNSPLPRSLKYQAIDWDYAVHLAEPRVTNTLAHWLMEKSVVAADLLRQKSESTSSTSRLRVRGDSPKFVTAIVSLRESVWGHA